MYAVDSGDSIAVATTIAKHQLKGKVGGSGWDVGVPVLQQVQAGALLFSIDQQAYLQGFVPTMQLFLYNLSGGWMLPVPGVAMIMPTRSPLLTVPEETMRLAAASPAVMLFWPTYAIRLLPASSAL